MTRISSINTLPEYTVALGPNPPNSTQFFIESLTVPPTFYLFDTPQVIIFTNSLAVDIPLTFTPSFWDINSFGTALIAQMNSNDVNVYTYAIDNLTGIVTITSSAPSTYALLLPPILSKAYGFTYVTTIVTSNPATGILTFGVGYFLRTNNFYIYCSQYPIYSAYESGLSDGNTDARSNNQLVGVFPFSTLNLAGQQGLNINNQGFNANQNYFGMQNPIMWSGGPKQSLNVRLADENGNTIYCNGAYWSIVFIFV